MFLSYFHKFTKPKLQKKKKKKKKIKEKKKKKKKNKFRAHIINWFAHLRLLTAKLKDRQTLILSGDSINFFVFNFSFC